MSDTKGLILIVDDTEENLEVLGNLLTENNYDLAIATNGIEAIESINTTIPDLVLLDVMMPEIDGFETCKRIKQQERTKDLPIIFLTAKVETEDIIRGFHVGGIDYITKPFRKEELLARVDTHVKLRKTQKALKESEAKLRNLVANSEDGIILISEEGRILEWNPKMEKFTGLFEIEVKNNFFWEIYSKLVSEDNIDLNENQIKNDIKYISQTGEISNRYKNQEVVITSIDGIKCITECSFFSIETENGFMTGAIFRDITVRKRIQEEIEKIQRLDSIGILAGGIAHNFNNIMQGIIGNIELAIEKIGKDHKINDLLFSALKSLPKAKELTNELITFAKNSFIRKSKVSVNNLIKLLINNYNNYPKVVFEYQTENNLWFINADEFQLKQAIENIIQNAIDSMKNIGTITIKTKNLSEDDTRKIPIIIQKGNYILISVKDEGIGIPKENYKRIFDPFFTTYKPTKRGLGLSIAHSIIRRHDGYIDFTSEIGIGSTFNIYLPVIEM